MSLSPRLRIAIALAAAVLFLLSLAYWWHGNLFHEIVGTLFLGALIAHNATVLRWYLALARGRWTVRRAYSSLVNLAILCLMVALAVTSLMVSQALFTALPINIGYSAREIHVLLAYWALIVLGLHLGVHWSRVLASVRNLIDIERNRLVLILARALALAIAAYGLHSVGTIMLAEKLLAIPALDMWDFTTNAGGFFLHYAAIVGLFACLGHYLAMGLQALHRPKGRIYRHPPG